MDSARESVAWRTSTTAVATSPPWWGRSAASRRRLPVRLNQLPGFEQARWAARRAVIQQMLLERTSSGFLDDGVREDLISEIADILRGDG